MVGFHPHKWNLNIPRAAEHPTPRQSTLTEVILSREIRCRITNHIEGTEQSVLTLFPEVKAFGSSKI
jgi:hypothetical protein